MLASSSAMYASGHNNHYHVTSQPNRCCLAGVQAELILGAVERKARSAQPSNSSYLEQRVQYLHEDAQLVNPESQGVMMAWEGPLMQAHAKVTPPWSCSALQQPT